MRADPLSAAFFGCGMLPGEKTIRTEAKDLHQRIPAKSASVDPELSLSFKQE